jgi:hypothetical protein
LEIRTSNQYLHDVRVAHAAVGFFFYDYSANTDNLISDVQIVDCDKAIKANGYTTTFQRVALRNALIHNVDTALYGYSFTGRVEHLTLHQCNKLAYDYNGTNYGTSSSLFLTNSLLVSVTNTGNILLIQSYCTNLASSNGVFQTVGAGGFYLADSSFRNTGTTSINSALATKLKEKTTYPPLVWSNLILTTDTTLAPQASRDSDTPDLGYHYDPIDHAVCWLIVTNALTTNGMIPVTLTVQPGTAVAQFGSRGIQMEFNSRLSAEGTGTAPVRIIRYHAVQEQSSVWGDASTEPYLVLGPPRDSVGSVTNAPAVNLQFVEGNLLGGVGYHLVGGSGWWLWTNIIVRDSQLSGGRFQASGHGGTIIDLKNNVFARVWQWYYAWPSMTAYNNLYYGCGTSISNAIVFDRYAGAGGWAFRDNAFHDNWIALLSTSQSVNNDHNAYVGTNSVYRGTNYVYVGTRLPDAGTGDLLLPEFSYTSGALGKYYHVTTNLMNRGSRMASDAGLYHYTTQTNHEKEGDSLVDIGFHHVATGASGTANDYDSDGLADYVEDANGNGTRDGSETDCQLSDTDYDGVNDKDEMADGSDPRDASSMVPKRLVVWTFNGSGSNWAAGDAGQFPLTNTAVQVTGWDGGAMQLNGPGTMLKYRDVESNGRPNINLLSGSVRFWFKPDWSTTNIPQGGRLFQVGVDSQAWWALHMISNLTDHGSVGLGALFGSYSAPGFGQSNYLALRLSNGCISWLEQTTFKTVETSNFGDFTPQAEVDTEDAPF